MKNYFVIKKTVTGNDVMPSGIMGLANVMSMFQLVSGLHTYEAGVDFNSILEKYNARWVITDVHFEINRFPANCDEITVETWPLKPHAVRFPRIFTLKDQNGDVLIKANSTWCLLDADTSAVLRASTIGQPFGEFRSDCPVAAAKRSADIPFCESDIHHTHTVRVSDLDMNRHVNNISYIRMGLDCFRLEDIEKLDMKSCSVFYKAQSYEGDVISLYKTHQDRQYYIYAVSQGHEVFRIVIQE